MKTIKCPSCGSEKIQILENDKAVCLVCDSVFNVHNYSKEFEKTTSHMDEKFGELGEDIRQAMKENRSEQVMAEYERLLENAQTQMKFGDESEAIKCAKRAIEIMPERAKGYIELYRILTNNYTLTNCYETFLNTKKNKDVKIWSDALAKASKCPDLDKNFFNEVEDFQKRCANRALSDIEANSKQANTFINEEEIKRMETRASIEIERENKEEKLKKVIKKTGLIISVLAVMLFVLIRFLHMDNMIAVIAVIAAGIAFFIFLLSLSKEFHSGIGKILIVLIPTMIAGVLMGLSL